MPSSLVQPIPRGRERGCVGVMTTFQGEVLICQKNHQGQMFLLFILTFCSEVSQGEAHAHQLAAL